MPTMKPRFTITLSDELYKRFEDFRFDNRYNLKSDAIAALIEMGLDVVEAQQKKQDEGDDK